MRFLLLLLVLLAPKMSEAAPADSLFSQSAPGAAHFLPVEQAFQFDWQQLDHGQVRLHWRIAPGYYLYRERLTFTGVKQPPNLPSGEAHHDDYFGSSTVYREDLEIIIPEGAKGVEVGWQGCADAGLCYPPQRKMLAPAPNSATSVAPLADDQALAAGLESRAFAYSLVLFFGLGLLLAFTPCTLPMLPILAAVVVGSGASTRRSAVLASGYVLSMALVYAALGSVAAALGTNLQAWLQQPWILFSFAALFAFLALPMFGLFELQLPLIIRERLGRAGQGQVGGSLSGAIFLGLLSGLLIGPCMTAPLAGALLYIAKSGDVFMGGAVLFALGLGTGLPLLLMVTVGQRWLPSPGAWMNAIKALFGFVLLGASWILVRPLMDPSLWLGVGGLLLFSLGYGARALSKSLRTPTTWLSGAGAVVMIWGAAMLLGAAGGGDDVLKPLSVYVAARSAGTTGADATFETISDPDVLSRNLEDARRQGQTVMIDYSADWCVACKVMEKEVFANREVQQALQGTRLLRLDVTSDSPESRALLKRYEVLGPPTVLWISPEGSEVRSQRISGEISRDQFLAKVRSSQEG
ncbi:protein-disulfide reductase DsbD [Pseudomonas aeruginosa]|nr:protein-disulfide reductase DsbD [Pseudomonas aeruginosa]MCS8829176.1 protein-disulfide reductase DsbD [Pseudomonas aeruginosa]MCS8874003.1 protein-disulfide reductase DsbD [Pseudomonas aeruginosa]MCS8907999.1 protein-disulfide reductase DsbD [Pseudomonas aeruginosa]MCS8914050.1 protein-disulfide reductase DsbD [Pseudomonas aeruginosa]